MSRQHDIGHTGVKNEFTPLIRAHEVKRILISVIQFSVYLAIMLRLGKGQTLSGQVNKNMLVRRISSREGIL